jgi:hypothetical protein
MPPLQDPQKADSHFMRQGRRASNSASSPMGADKANEVADVANSAKAIVGLRPSFSAHVRFGERGAPVDYLGRCYDHSGQAKGGYLTLPPL